jgi:hypothetical protein
MVETVSPPILAAILGSKSRTRFEKVIIIMTKLDPFWGTL